MSVYGEDYTGVIKIVGYPTVLLKNGKYQLLYGEFIHAHVFPKGTDFDFNIFDPLMWHKKLIEMIEDGTLRYKREDGVTIHYRVAKWGGVYKQLFPGPSEKKDGENLSVAVYGDIAHPHWKKEWAKRKK